MARLVTTTDSRQQTPQLAASILTTSVFLSVCLA